MGIECCASSAASAPRPAKHAKPVVDKDPEERRLCVHEVSATIPVLPESTHMLLWSVAREPLPFHAGPPEMNVGGD